MDLYRKSRIGEKIPKGILLLLGIILLALPALASAQLPTVTVAASDAAASEVGLDTGTFTFTRVGHTTSALTVSYTIGGTATNGEDYVAIPGSVTIPAGSTTATITVTPIDDALVEDDETVILTLNPDPSYIVGTPDSATVTIISDDALPTVTISATDPIATEVGLTIGTFAVSRTGSTAADLLVFYPVDGTAAAGIDYVALSGSVTIPAGSSTATIPVTPMIDLFVEGEEAVIVALAADAAYAVGTTDVATVGITDANAALKCYKVLAAKAPKGQPPFPKFDPQQHTGIRLTDQFGNKLTDVLKPLSICNPVVDEGTLTLLIHLEGYQIKDGVSKLALKTFPVFGPTSFRL